MTIEMQTILSDDIKKQTARQYADLHQSELFQFDDSETGAWQKTWDHLVNHLDINSEDYTAGATIEMEKGETKSGDKETLVVNFGDVDSNWWTICLHFNIETWDQAGLQKPLESDFYGADIELKNPETGEVKLLSAHITDFLEKYPLGGTQGQSCPMQEIFSLEEI